MTAVSLELHQQQYRLVHHSQKIDGLSNIINVAAGDAFGMALDKYGNVWAWGSNNKGQLGIGNIGTAYATPQSVSTVDSVTAISAGSENALLLRSNGTIWAMGANDSGQGGVGNNTGELWLPTEVRDIEAIVAIAAGYDHSIALAFTSSVYATGSDQHGQLGNTPSATKNTYTKILTDAVTIAAGNKYSTVIGKDGNMYVFGQNNKGQLGIGDTVERNIPIANAVIDTIKSSYNDFAIAGVSLGDEYSVFYTRNGDVYGYGDYSLGTPVARNETKSYVPVLIGERTELISKYEMTIHVGETATLDTYSGKKFNLITDYDNPGSISFESKNTAIADVTAVGDDGEITGNKIGISSYRC